MTTELKRMQQKHGTTSEWSGANPVLLAGEFGYNDSNGLYKVGDGVSAWNDLAYKGQNGAQGPAGQNGTDGKSILNGTTNPSNGTGVDGDFYLNTVSEVLFGPKAAGAWPGSGVSLVGPQGTAGTPGADGKTILNGTTNPNSGVGVNGDFYINTATSTLFGPKAAGAWPSGVSLIGPQGPNGLSALVIGGDASGSVGSGGPILTLTVNEVGGASAADVAAATALVGDATADDLPDTLVLRDGSGVIKGKYFLADAGNNEYMLLNRPGTAFQMGIATFAGVRFDFIAANSLCQFFDDAAFQQAVLLSRFSRHLALSVDGTNPARGVQVVAAPGQTAPLLRLLAEDNTTVKGYFDINGQLMLGSGTPTDTISVNGTASKTGGGSWATFSDVSLKDITGRWFRGLKSLLKLQPVLYRFKDKNHLGASTTEDHIGFVAQDVQQAIPEAVVSKDVTGVDGTTKPLLSINQDYILWTAVNAIRELNEKVDALEKLIAKPV